MLLLLTVAWFGHTSYCWPLLAVVCFSMLLLAIAGWCFCQMESQTFASCSWRVMYCVVEWGIEERRLLAERLGVEPRRYDITAATTTQFMWHWIA